MDSNQIEETAAIWMARRDSGHFGDAEAAELALWLRASTAHRVAFIRLENMWREANRLRALGAGVSPGIVPTPGEWQLSPFFDSRADRAHATSAGAVAHSLSAPAIDDPLIDDEGIAEFDSVAVAEATPPYSTAQSALPSIASTESVTLIQPVNRRRSFARTGALAASMLIATAIGIGWYLWPTGSAYQTPIGGVEAVALPDGSNVTLNTNSEIRVAVTDTERRIELKRGEAFFEVAKDPTRPFVVMAGEQRVVAVGTKFSVRRAERGADEVRVVVTEGRVLLGPAGAGPGAELPPAEVVAGSIARSGGAGVLLDARPARPVEEYLSWRSGYLMFRDTALADAIGEFNRYNATQLVIEDRAIAAIQIGGNFRSTNVDAFVRLLENGFPVHVERRGDEIVLTAN